MKKILFIFLLNLVSVFAIAQYLPTYIRPHNQEELNNYIVKIDDFKKRTTIFVLPTYIEPQHYHSVLEEYWTFNAFKVIPAKVYNVENYISEEFIVFDLALQIKYIRDERGAVSPLGFHTFLTLRTFNKQLPSIIKNIKRKKIKESKKKRKIEDAFNSNNYQWLKIFLATDKSFNGLTDDIKDLYTKDIINNFSLGHFKNYIQRLNKDLNNYQLFTKSRTPDAHVVSPDLLNLSAKTLFIYDIARKNKKGISNQDYINKLFKDYPFETKVISKKELERYMLENKDEYYFSFFTLDTLEKVILISNTKTGKVVYRHLIPGTSISSSNLKKKHIKRLIEEFPRNF